MLLLFTLGLQSKSKVMLLINIDSFLRFFCWDYNMRLRSRQSMSMSLIRRWMLTRQFIKAGIDEVLSPAPLDVVPSKSPAGFTTLTTTFNMCKPHYTFTWTSQELFSLVISRFCSVRFDNQWAGKGLNLCAGSTQQAESAAWGAGLRQQPWGQASPDVPEQPILLLFTYLPFFSPSLKPGFSRCPWASDSPWPICPS